MKLCGDKKTTDKANNTTAAFYAPHDEEYCPNTVHNAYTF